MVSRWVIALVLASGCTSYSATFAGPDVGGSGPESTQEASGGSTTESSTPGTGGFTALGFGGATVAPVTVVATGGSSAVATTTAAAGGVSPATVSTAAIGGTRSLTASAAGGATMAATTATECRFLSPQASGIVDMGPCSVYDKGRSRCVSGVCTYGGASEGWRLDCDHDGIAETSSLTDANCGACGHNCTILQLHCRTNGRNEWYSCQI